MFEKLNAQSVIMNGMWGLCQREEVSGWSKSRAELGQ